MQKQHQKRQMTSKMCVHEHFMHKLKKSDQISISCGTNHFISIKEDLMFVCLKFNLMNESGCLDLELLKCIEFFNVKC